MALKIAIFSVVVESEVQAAEIEGFLIGSDSWSAELVEVRDAVTDEEKDQIQAAQDEINDLEARDAENAAKQKAGWDAASPEERKKILKRREEALKMLDEAFGKRKSD